MKRVVISEPVKTCIELLDDYADVYQLLNALVKYGKGEEINRDDLYVKVEKAFDYLTHPQRVDQVFVDDNAKYH